MEKEGLFFKGYVCIGMVFSLCFRFAKLAFTQKGLVGNYVPREIDSIQKKEFHFSFDC